MIRNKFDLAVKHSYSNGLLYYERNIGIKKFLTFDTCILR